MTDQLALFDADGADASLDDLDGLLLGTGHVVRRSEGARVSVLVDEIWRAEALCDELRQRGLEASYEIARDDSGTLLVGVRATAHLLALAERWQPGRRRTAQHKLSAGGLRLWAIASGRAIEHAYQLSVSPTDQLRWPRAGAALAQFGLTATLVGPRAGGPAYRITTTKRLRRLAALLGPRPDGAPEYLWP